MKELVGTARNLSFSVNGPRISAMVELILVVTEPVYRVEGKEMVRERKTETIRVAMCKEACQMLLTELAHIEEEMDTISEHMPMNLWSGESESSDSSDSESSYSPSSDSSISNGDETPANTGGETPA